MLYTLPNPFVVGAISLILAAVLTYAVREAARRYGHVATPRSDRWHKRPTAMFGGIAIFVTTLILYAALVPKSPETIILIAMSSVLFIVGLVDDILNIKPYQKLIGQLIGASLLIAAGARLPLTGYELVDTWITVFWLIGITNAVNLLDNMDGLAAGIAVIAAVSLAIGLYVNGQVAEAILVSIFIGALLGFLIFNFNPASIFMGDCGSMFVGFFLAGSVLLSDTGGRSRGVLSIMAVPVLILFVPIFDTTLVTVLRKLWGRKASQGGRDHTSHRLVALGLSERSAVLMIYAFAFAAGVLALLVSRLNTFQSLALIAAFTIVLSIIGVFLSKVKVYDEREEDLAIRNNAVFAFLVDVSYKRRIFEVFLDAWLITLSYYAAYVLLFGSFERSGNWDLFIKTLPLLVVLKLFAFLAVGVYRGLWRYTSVGDLITFGKGVMLGSAFSVVAVLLLYRFQNFSRAVFVLDGIILLFALVGSRMAFRLIREVLPIAGSGGGRRVLIYGAGDGGEMVLRELRNNPEWNYLPVGFVDNDPLKVGKVINGLRVYDGNGSLIELCREHDVADVLISFRHLDAGRVVELRRMCREANIGLHRAHLQIESFDYE
jgi:UDP-GlcNAc:undecaprenyl-phosphate/decaprenyl-phosphate GlcNAc-1-phosphate transferase